MGACQGFAPQDGGASPPHALRSRLRRETKPRSLPSRAALRRGSSVAPANKGKLLGCFLPLASVLRLCKLSRSSTDARLGASPRQWWVSRALWSVKQALALRAIPPSPLQDLLHEEPRSARRRCCSAAWLDRHPGVTRLGSESQGDAAELSPLPLAAKAERSPSGSLLPSRPPRGSVAPSHRPGGALRLPASSGSLAARCPCATCPSCAPAPPAWRVAVPGPGWAGAGSHMRGCLNLPSLAAAGAEAWLGPDFAIPSMAGPVPTLVSLI